MTTRHLALPALFSFLFLFLASVHAAPLPPSAETSSGTFEAGGARFAVPAGWVTVPPEPATASRAAQWVLPQGGQAVAFYFGDGKGGDVRANLNVLAKMMTTATGAPARQVAEGGNASKNGILKTSWFACYGIYGGDPLRSGIPALPKPEWGLIGFVAEFPGGPVYFRITGPASLVQGLLPRLQKPGGLFSPVLIAPPSEPAPVSRKGSGKSKEATK